MTLDKHVEQLANRHSKERVKITRISDGKDFYIDVTAAVRFCQENDIAAEIMRVGDRPIRFGLTDEQYDLAKRQLFLCWRRVTESRP